jgi:hypothetical protein
VPLKPEIAKLLATPELPELGPGPRTGVQPEGVLAGELHRILQSRSLSEERQELIRALLLLWHDHLEAAHVIAQSIDNADGAFVHGIVHRREPDYANAAYWFRRVGQHPVLLELGQSAGNFLEASGAGELRKELTSGGAWDPFAFVRACEAAAGGATSAARQQLLRELQRLESEALLERFCSQSRSCSS